MAVKFQKILLTPELAAKLKAANTQNRKLSEQRVNTLVGVIERDGWEFDGNPLKQAEDGRFMDGSHRLEAVIRTGKPVETLLITGLPWSAMMTIDSGKVRTFNDYLRIMGVHDVANVGAGTRLLWDFRQGNLGARGNWADKLIPTNQQLYELYAQMESLHELAEAGFGSSPHVKDTGNFTTALQVARKVRLRMKASIGVIMTAVMILSYIDPADAKLFFDQLSLDAPVKPGDPAMAVTRYFNNKDRQKQIRGEFALAIIFKGWNRYRDGDSIQMLAFKPGGATRERYPVPA
jgi:hypothetical protein